MKKSLFRKYYAVIVILTSMMFTSCSMADIPDNSGGVNPPSTDDRRYLNICLDGKVSQYGDDGELVPVAGIEVTMRDADGCEIATTRTKEYGRFLIEESEVAVGNYWEKHIYVEITDDAERIGYTKENELRSQLLTKHITTAPNSTAILTMDDIVMERVVK